MFEQRLTVAAFGFLIVVGYTRADEVSAVKAIKDAHGRITRDEKQPGKPVIAIDLRRRPRISSNSTILIRAA